MQTNITRYNFEKELIEMAASCVGLKEATAKTKVKNILKKYDEIISHTKEHQEYYLEERRKYQNLFHTLKSGAIKDVNEEQRRTILIKNIEQIRVKADGVVLTVKGGREIKLSTDFKYLQELF